MTMNTRAFLAMWHDIEVSAEAEFSRWHTREHMPERVGIPGFRRGRRLVNPDMSFHRWGTIYEGEDLEVFRSPAYLARLNAPTPWTTRMQPAFRNFLRVACETVAVAGGGVGGALATIRLDFAGGGEQPFLAALPVLRDELMAVLPVAGLRFGIARPEISTVKTRETELRPRQDQKGFDVVVLVEGISRRELDAAMVHIEGVLAHPNSGVQAPVSAVYDLAYLLSAGEGVEP